MTQHHPLLHQEPGSFSGKERLPIKPSRKSLIGYGLLFGIVLVLAEAALGVLSGRFSSPVLWFYGTPVCYLLFSGLCALTTTGVQEDARKRPRGYVSGLLTSLVGASLGSLVMISFVVITVRSFQASPPPCTGHCLPGPGLGILILLFFLPIFLLVNFGSVVLGLLGGMFGGMLGGVLRSSLSGVRNRKDPLVPSSRRDDKRMHAEE